jgi:DNA (cytosine-5)-methyltransferase 1
MENKVLKRASIELFAGAGGLGLGLSNAGFEPKVLVELDERACQSLKLNMTRPLRGKAPWNISNNDIRQIDFTEFNGKIDLVSGGPPCQPFSMGGRHKANGDARDMFPEAIRAIRQIRPKAFVFENVKGLTRATFANYFQYIQLQMRHPELAAQNDEDWSDHLRRLENHHLSGSYSDLQYRVVARVLNAADYGVPQRRDRVIFVGFREDLDIDWAFPRPTYSFDTLLWRKFRSTEYRDEFKISRETEIGTDREMAFAAQLPQRPATCSWKTIRDALADLPEPSAKDDDTFQNHKHQSGARKYAGHTGSPLDMPAKALKAGVHGVPGGENMIRFPCGDVRYFSVRESARIQTFPDWYRFEAGWSESMRQLGNAVPVHLAEVIGKSVSRALDYAI